MAKFFRQKAPISSAEPGLLRAELIAGEAEDREAAVLIGAVESFKGGVLRSEAALAGGVYDEQNLAAELLQSEWAAVHEGRGEGIDGQRLLSHAKTSLEGSVPCGYGASKRKLQAGRRMYSRRNPAGSGRLWVGSQRTVFCRVGSRGSDGRFGRGA